MTACPISERPFIQVQLGFDAIASQVFIARGPSNLIPPKIHRNRNTQTLHVMPPPKRNIQTLSRRQNALLILCLNRQRPFLHEFYPPPIHTSSAILTCPFVRLERGDSWDIDERSVGDICTARIRGAGIEELALLWSVEAYVFVAYDLG